MPSLIHLQITLLHVTKNDTLLLSLLFLSWIHLSTKAISTTEYLTLRQEAPGFQSPKQGFPACHGWLWWMNKPSHFPLTLSFAGIPSSVHHYKSSAFGPPSFVPCFSVAHLSLVSWFPVELISKAPFLKFFKNELQFLAILILFFFS